MSRLPRLLPLVAIAIGGVIAVRAAGSVPGLFQGAMAWAEEAVPAETAPSSPIQGVCTLSDEQLAEQAGISPAELRVIRSLSDRRIELDAREEELATVLPLLIAAEQKLEARITELNGVKTEVEGLLGQLDEKEQAEIDRLVQVYSAMRPREAAAVFVTLDDSVRLPVAAAMRPRVLAAILAQMPPAAARELTEKLADHRQGRQLEARARAAADGVPAPAAPVETAAPRTTPQAEAPAPRSRQSASRPASQSAPSQSASTQSASAQSTPTPSASPPPASAATAGAPPPAVSGTPATRPARQTVQ